MSQTSKRMFGCIKYSRCRIQPIFLFKQEKGRTICVVEENDVNSEFAIHLTMEKWEEDVQRQFRVEETIFHVCDYQSETIGDVNPIGLLWWGVKVRLSLSSEGIVESSDRTSTRNLVLVSKTRLITRLVIIPIEALNSIIFYHFSVHCIRFSKDSEVSESLSEFVPTLPRTTLILFYISFNSSVLSDMNADDVYSVARLTVPHLAGDEKLLLLLKIIQATRREEGPILALREHLRHVMIENDLVVRINEMNEMEVIDRELLDDGDLDETIGVDLDEMIHRLERVVQIGNGNDRIENNHVAMDEDVHVGMDENVHVGMDENVHVELDEDVHVELDENETDTEENGLEQEEDNSEDSEVEGL
ncbi:hypothetical protein GCK72_003985 [Caenorhabditis remanei]|uniref:Uncharacterized protein n=1 Tax=Caenorhabditis remanei TaxID=31234 RepID=A0A6A5HAF7_CAERE|nr:hypothetical protein GCK72_003985 [Caenorhabditis remanei]KAF1764039.1 hypothetical protein GCK72_003985 [Caenorhabditis remanei]